MNMNWNPLRNVANPMSALAGNAALFNACCFVTGHDADLMHEVPRSERNAMCLQAVFYVLFALFTFGAWTFVALEYMPVYLAIPFSFVLSGMILLLDQHIVASDWSLKGVLATAADKADMDKRLFSRMAVAMVFGVTTALSFISVQFAGPIDEFTRVVTAQKNAALVSEIDGLKASAKSRITAPVQAQLDALSTELNQAIAAAGNRENAALAASQRANQATIEANREKFGDLKGYKKGEGPNFREAIRQQEAADKLAANSASQVSGFNARADRLKAQFDQKTVELSAANAALLSEEVRLSQQMRNDPRWNPVNTDFLSRMLGLLALLTDPVKGWVVVPSFITMFLTLITIDMLPVLIKRFAPASIYTVRLIARTKAMAMQIDLELQREYASLQASHAQQLAQIAQTVDVMPKMSLGREHALS